jgi:hypothetical protein
MEALSTKTIVVPITTHYHFISIFQVVDRGNVSKFSTKFSKTKDIRIKSLRIPFYKHILYES